MAKTEETQGSTNVSRGIAHIKATFNNTTVTITDTNGDVLCWATAGTSGFKGSRKSTPFAAQRAAEICAERAAKFGIKEDRSAREGAGVGSRKRHHRAAVAGLQVKAIEDVTPLPHNGCRPPKEAPRLVSVASCQTGGCIVTGN